MAGYIGSKASVVSNGAERKKVFDITATTTSLTGCSYTPNQVHVFHNGVRLVDGTDYTATDGSTVTLTTAAQSGDEVVVVSYATFQPADAYTKTESDGRFVNDPNAVITVSGSNVGIGMTPTGALSIRPSGTGSEDTHFGYGANLDAYITTGSNGNVIFREGNGAGVTTEHMRIDSSGNVGIGTTSPATKLDVNGGVNSAHLTLSGTAGRGLKITTSNPDGQSDAAVYYNAQDSEASGVYAQHIFETAGTERLRIASNGNLVGGNSTGTSWKIQWSSYGDTCLDLRRYADAGNVCVFRDDLTVAGTISVSGSSASYNTSSDYRLKENVTPLDGAADRLAQIPVHRFNFIADPDTTVDGFLAHEVQAFVPEAITGEKDGVDADGNPEYQGIDQSKLVPLLTAALQEALQKIDALEARVAALEAV